MQYAALEKKRILNWQRRAEEKRRAEEEERRAELERTQKNAHLDAVRERNIENIVQRRSAQEEELLKKEKERQLIKEVKARAFKFICFIFFSSNCCHLSRAIACIATREFSFCVRSSPFVRPARGASWSANDSAVKSKKRAARKRRKKCSRRSSENAKRTCGFVTRGLRKRGRRSAVERSVSSRKRARGGWNCVKRKAA